MQEIVAYRIKSARLLRGFSQSEIAEEVGVSKQMISKYEKGQSMPSSSILIKLAKFFGLKVDYFFRSFQINLGEINFRKKSSFGKRKQTALKEQVKIRLENYLWLENILSLDPVFVNPIINFDISSNENVEAAVLEVRSKWNIGIDPLHNIIQLLESKKIKVIEIDIDSKFDGLATYIDEKYPVIVVNANFPVERKRFTILHELGHLLLNISSDCDKKKEEGFCNKFASEFLLSKEFIVSEFGGTRGFVSFNELTSVQKTYGISIAAIVYKLGELKILNKERLTGFYKKMNYSPSFKGMVNKSRFVTPEKSRRYKQLVYRAFTEEVISMSKAAALLDFTTEEFKEHYLPAL